MIKFGTPKNSPLTFRSRTIFNLELGYVVDASIRSLTKYPVVWMAGIGFTSTNAVSVRPIQQQRLPYSSKCCRRRPRIRAALSDSDTETRQKLAGLRVVVTGGTGLLGRAVVRALLSSGSDVTVFARRPNAVPRRAAAMSYDAATGVLTPAALAALRVADAVINLAGEPIDSGRWTSERKRVLRDSRVTGTAALARHIGANSRFITASAVGYYGAGRLGVCTEVSAPGNDYLASLATEWESASTGPRTVTVCRFGVVLSSDGGAAQRLAAAFRAFVGGAPGDGGQYISWVHTDDAVRFMLRAIAEDTPGVFNVCAPEAVTMRQLCEELGVVLQRPNWLPVPAVLVKALAGAEAAALVLQGQRVVPSKAMKAGFSFRFGEVDEALRDVFAAEVIQR